MARGCLEPLLSGTVIYIHSKTKTNNMRQYVGARPVVYFGSMLWVFFCTFFFCFYSYNVTSALSLTKNNGGLGQT